MKSKIDPIDTSEEIEKYKAHSESRELDSKRCKHERAEYKDGEVRCVCGAAWSGERIHELLKVLQN